MNWEIELIEILRALLFDLEETPTYSDSTLKRLLLVAAHYVVREAGFSDYVVDISEAEIDPDPTSQDTANEDFVNLIALKAACIVDQGAARTANAGGILIRDDKAVVDFRDKAAKALEILKQGWCSTYEQALLEYRHDRSSATAAAVLSPFRIYACSYGTLDFK